MKKQEHFHDELSKQYNILIKAEKREQTKRRVILFIIFVLTFLVALTSAFFSYKAYQNTNNILEENKKKNTSYETLSVVFSNSSNLNINNIINSQNLSEQKIITIKNEGNKEIKYDLVISDIKSTLASTTNLKYTLTSNNEIVVNKSLPLTQDKLLSEVTILPDETKTYILNTSFTGSLDANTTNNYYAKLKVEQTASASSLLE